MTITHVESSEDLNLLVQELWEHSDEESMGIVEESNTEKDEDIAGLSPWEVGRVCKGSQGGCKEDEETKKDYRSLLVRYKEAKCEIETLNGELTEAYTKVRFLELEVVQANVKVERVSTKKLDDVLSS